MQRNRYPWFAGACLIASTLLVSGCDPAAKGDKAEAGDKADKKAGAGDKADKKAEVGAEAGADAGAAEDPGPTDEPEADPAEDAASSCLAKCDDPELSKDDAATCRVRCKTEATSETGRYAGCFDDCVGKSETNQVTCTKNCAASIRADTDEAGTCGRGCLETLGSCLLPCEDEGKDDRATCRVRCNATADSCLDDCDA